MAFQSNDMANGPDNLAVLAPGNNPAESVPVSQPRPGRFVPRATLVLAGGVALFFVLAMLYSAPIWLEPAPEGAPANYVEQRVQEHLKGKIIPIFAISLVSVAVLVARPWKR
jgi:hypothetical protein